MGLISALSCRPDHTEAWGRRIPFAAIALIVLIRSHQAKAGVVNEVYGLPGNPQPSSLTLGSDGALYGVTTSEGGVQGYGSVFRVTTNGSFSTLASFAFTNGANPDTPLVEGPDHAFYGSAPKGGTSRSNGTVFRVATNGLLSALFSFTGINGPYYGRYPRALCVGPDSSIYGTTYYGGLYDGGVIFRVTTNGEFSVIVSLSSIGADAGLSEGLVLGRDGWLYGAGAAAGPQGHGTIFKVSVDGNWSTLAYFNGTNGTQPSARVMFGSDGNIYGTTYFGGSYGYGTVFRCSTNGVLIRLASLSASDANSKSRLAESGGAFYGTSQGASGKVFCVSPTGTLYTLFSFNGVNGNGPCDELVVGIDGALYGTTFGGGDESSGTVFRLAMSAAHANLYSFPANLGGRPQGGLCLASDGKFYGTASSGGVSNLGTIFKVNTQGEFTMLGSFTDTNGRTPQDGVIQGADGAFYGTTVSGGSGNLGVLFRLDMSGELNSLRSFDSDIGSYPHGSLLQGSDGTLYGTTFSGGADFQGTVFKATTNGALTRLASLNGTFGAKPYAGLTFGRDGALYGTASEGGSMNGGTVFRVTTNGVLSLVASFDPVSGQGNSPRAPLLLGKDDAFYGTTFYTSTNNTGAGTVFKVTTNGALTILATFAGNPQPAYPRGGPLVQGSDGALYGATPVGGTGFGTIYRLTTNGDLTVLVSFDNDSGSGPSGVIQAPDGFFYGTSASGGSFGNGNVFRVCLISKMRPLIRAGQGLFIDFDGIRGNTYRVQRAVNLSGPWSTLGFWTIGPDGVGHYADSGPLPNAAFYRTVYP